jgi:hypothetical protein
MTVPPDTTVDRAEAPLPAVEQSDVAEGDSCCRCPRRALRVELGASPCTRTKCGLQALSHGVCCPTTLAEAGSDQHQVCLTWLCCAFRLSQPLDALFRPQPVRPCFMPVTPLGFRFQRFSLSSSGSHVSARPSLRAVCIDRRGHLPGWVLPGQRLQGFAHLENPYQSDRCYPAPDGRSSLSVAPLRGVPPIGLGLVLPRSLLSWALLQH